MALTDDAICQYKRPLVMSRNHHSLMAHGCYGYDVLPNGSLDGIAYHYNSET